MPKGLWWTGVGLLSAGGLTMLIGVAVKNSDDCGFDFDCETLGNGYYVLGGILAGAGAALMITANAKRERLPSVMFTPHGGIGMQQRISF
jgi:hypothetical protein